MRGQGALEYLLILAAVLAIAAIVIYVVSSAGRGAQEDTLSKGCINALGSCKFLKTATGANQANNTACAITCRPCGDYDTFLTQQGRPAATPNYNTCLIVPPA